MHGRRSFSLKPRWCWIVVCSLLGGVLAEPARAQATDTVWWPSEWGPEDERGAANRITAERVIEAARSITEGKIYPLGRTYQLGMPLFGNRHFSLTIPGLPTGGPFGTNKIVWNDELFSGEIGQIGTQFDGLGHVGMQVNGEYVFYNGFKLSEFGDTYGLRKLGIEKAGPFFARGILLDVAAYKKVDRLAPDYIISIDDIEGTLRMEGIELREGDVVLFHTGHGALWMEDNDAYSATNPGPGITAIKWLIERKIVMTGADTGSVEAVPGEHADRPFEAHQWLMMRNGIYNLENLDLAELAADRVYEFAFIFAPLPLKGATGSPGNPIAVR